LCVSFVHSYLARHGILSSACQTTLNDESSGRSVETGFFRVE
ncbi:unnamed protein product, partial [Allacma fusca]